MLRPSNHQRPFRDQELEQLIRYAVQARVRNSEPAPGVRERLLARGRRRLLLWEARRPRIDDYERHLELRPDMLRRNLVSLGSSLVYFGGGAIAR